jgi:hypothetical protein
LRGGKGGPTLGGWEALKSGAGGAAGRKGFLLPTILEVLSVRTFEGELDGLGLSRKGSRLWPAGRDLRKLLLGGDGGAEPEAPAETAGSAGAELVGAASGGEMPQRGGSVGLGASTAGPLMDREPREWLRASTLGTLRGGASRGGVEGSRGSGSTVCMKIGSGSGEQRAAYSTRQRRRVPVSTKINRKRQETRTYRE